MSVSKTSAVVRRTSVTVKQKRIRRRSRTKLLNENKTRISPAAKYHPLSIKKMLKIIIFSNLTKNNISKKTVWKTYIVWFLPPKVELKKLRIGFVPETDAVWKATKKVKSKRLFIVFGLLSFSLKNWTEFVSVCSAWLYSWWKITIIHTLYFG